MQRHSSAPAIPSISSSSWRMALTGLTALALAGLALPASAAIPTSERQVLINLYDNTDGDNWTDNSNWNDSPGTECNWEGISCDSSEDHVIAINLDYHNLSGTLPDLSDLTKLRNINVRDNNLSGTIPNLPALTELKRVRLLNNSLSGPLPALPPSIEEFRAGNNQLSGTIPDLSSYTSLEHFNVLNNQLSGSIPELPALPPSLKRLHVQLNQLSGQLPSLPASITHFTAFNNNLSGSIPDLSTLTSLAAFQVQNNQLSGAPASAPPTSLTGALVCPNYLELSGDSVIDSAWETATGNTPWNQGCTSAPQPPTEATAIPTLSAWTLALLSLLLGGIAIWRRQNAG